MIGERFSRLTIESPAGKTARGQRLWLCRCDCGGSATATTGGLRFGNPRSCGCLRREVAGAKNRRHGETGGAEHRIWTGMLRRCRNPRATDYADYGGRGIAVCERWTSYEAFLADMGRMPTATHSIERLDNSRGYEPDNCKWVPRAEQARNQRRRRDNTSGVTGITWKEPNRKWQVNIGHQGRLIYLGLFADLDQAIAVRKAKAAELGFSPNHGGAR